MDGNQLSMFLFLNRCNLIFSVLCVSSIFAILWLKLMARNLCSNKIAFVMYSVFVPLCGPAEFESCLHVLRI